MTTRVMLVEDNKNVREFCVRALAGAGYEVAAFSNAAEAVAHREFKPDVLITDFGLPDNSGVDLSKTLQARHSTLLVLLISGHPLEEFYQEDLPLTHGYLEKPFNAGELVAALQKLMAPVTPAADDHAGRTSASPRARDEWHRITGPYQDWE